MAAPEREPDPESGSSGSPGSPGLSGCNGDGEPSGGRRPETI